MLFFLRTPKIGGGWLDLHRSFAAPMGQGTCNQKIQPLVVLSHTHTKGSRSCSLHWVFQKQIPPKRGEGVLGKPYFDNPVVFVLCCVLGGPGVKRVGCDLETPPVVGGSSSTPNPCQNKKMGELPKQLGGFYGGRGGLVAPDVCFRMGTNTIERTR